MIKIFYMDEGIIYEEGTPEEFFKNPKKDKTLQFVKKLFVLEEEILSRDYDFEVLVKKIYTQMTQMKSIGNIWHNSVLLLDELINNVLFVLLEDPLHIHLRMECKKDSIVLNVEYGGTELDLKSLLLEKAKSPVGTEKQDDWLPVSARIINSYAEDMTYTRQEGELRNRIRISGLKTGDTPVYNTFIKHSVMIGMVMLLIERVFSFSLSSIIYAPGSA